MNRLQIETVDGRTAFDPGEEIEALLEWDLEEEPESVELRLVWNTAGKGTTDLAVVRTVRFDSPLRQESRRATVRLPRSPYSFSGKLISLIWALELVALPGGEAARTEITLAPGGREVVLHGNEDAHEEEA
jgi:hypothetical protein